MRRGKCPGPVIEAPNAIVFQVDEDILGWVKLGHWRSRQLRSMGVSLKHCEIRERAGFDLGRCRSVPAR